MSMNPLQPVGAAAGAGALQPIYQLDPETAGAMKKCRERLHSICSQHMNRPVRVQTVHGQTHDGYIVHIDSDFIYLQIMPGHSRAFLPSAALGRTEASGLRHSIPIITMWFCRSLCLIFSPSVCCGSFLSCQKACPLSHSESRQAFPYPRPFIF